MALSGTFSNSYQGYTYQISWSATQSTSGNYSTITCVHKLICASSWSLYIESRSNTCSVNGISHGFTSSAVRTGGNATFTLGTTTHTVNHDSNGVGSFSITGTFNMQATISGVWVSSIVTSGSATLNTIARASTITSASDVVLGNACNVIFTPASSSFYYQIYFTLGNWTVSTGWVYPGTTSSYTYNYLVLSGTLADGSGDTLYAQLPNTVYGTMTATLYTYSSKDTNTLIGSSSKTFTVTIPESVKPSISSGNISLSPTTYAYLIQNKNYVKISVSGCSAGTGSSIASYTYSGPGISTGAISSTSATSEIISTSGTLTYTVTVTDTRGRTASATQTITCQPYTVPYFTSFNAHRVASTSSTAAVDDGTYIRFTYSMSYATVNNTNKITVKLQHKVGSGNWSSVASDITSGTATSGGKTIGIFDATQTYVVRAEVTDNYGVPSYSDEITIFSAERILNVRPSGDGIAFGKMAGTDNLLDSKWPIKTDSTIESVGAIKTGAPAQTMKNLTFRGNDATSLSNDTTAKWGAQGNLATVFYTQTGLITDQPSTYGFVLNLTNGPSGAEVHQLWATQASGSLLHRGGNSNGWSGTWRAILDSYNYTSYVSPKPTTLFSSSTGTIGTITLSSSAANFTYLEIFYTDNNGRQAQSIKVYAPNGKYVTLTCAEPRTGNVTPRMYIRSSGWTISGTTMTAGRTDLTEEKNGVYTQLGQHVGGTDIYVDVAASTSIKIFRVLGYA